MEFLFNEYCPLKKENIDEAECIEITAELDKLKTEEHLIKLRKTLNMTNKEMLEICRKCPNYEDEC
ncbi:MAG: D52 family tumor protein [Clostridia bacterium]|nr:D52 family tumor protein [Clostridia bacterium]